jgi:succinate dehydrogenase/fumarate reductase iron-sulfur protein
MVRWLSAMPAAERSALVRRGSTARPAACKTLIDGAASDRRPVVLEPLLNTPVVKDLVVDQEPFFREIRRTRPWLIEGHGRAPDDPIDYAAGMNAQEYDEWNRTAVCIRCLACFSDCPKRGQDQSFIGPEACVDIYKRAYDVREGESQSRLKRASGPAASSTATARGSASRSAPRTCGRWAILFLQGSDQRVREDGHGENRPARW